MPPRNDNNKDAYGLSIANILTFWIFYYNVKRKEVISMGETKPDYNGLMHELGTAGIDEIKRGPGGTVILSDEYFEGIDPDLGSCVINFPIGRKAFPEKFGFAIEEGDVNGINHVVLVPRRDS